MGRSLHDSIIEKYPKPKVFLEHEKKVLQLMIRIREIQKTSYLLSDLKRALNFLHKNGYSFHSKLSIAKDDPSLGGRDAEVFVGADVSIDTERNVFKQIVYVMSIIVNNEGLDDKFCRRECFRNDNGSYRPRIIRRFHFDYDTTNYKNHPMYHLQYGGNAEPSLKEFHYCLEPWLETPRILFPPINLSLLFEIVLREFKTEVENTILEKGEWKNILRSSEKLIIEPYINCCHSYFNKTGTKNTSPSFIHWHYGTK